GATRAYAAFRTLSRVSEVSGGTRRPGGKPGVSGLGGLAERLARRLGMRKGRWPGRRSHWWQGGNVTLIARPPDGRGRTDKVAPCALAIAATIDRPRPSPSWSCPRFPSRRWEGLQQP